MITYEIFEEEVKKKNIKNGYVFCGLDEELIKEGIDMLTLSQVKEEFKDLNVIKIDGNNTTFDEIMNACETMPFMDEKKVIIVYRANFLQEKTDSTGLKIYNEMKEYISNMPPHTILIMYYLCKDKRDKPNKNRKLTSIEKHFPIVYCDKLKRDRYIKKIESLFIDNKIKIGRTEVVYFSQKVQNNFDIIKREIEKIGSYCDGREVKRTDIDLLVSYCNEDDVFDLIELVAEKKIDRAMDIMKEILYRFDQHMLIIVSIQKHFSRLYHIKSRLSEGADINTLKQELHLPQFVCEKLAKQSRKFTIIQLCELVKLCLTTEIKLKTCGSDKDMEMEFLLIKTLTVKKS